MRVCADLRTHTHTRVYTRAQVCTCAGLRIRKGGSKKMRTKPKNVPKRRKRR